MKTSRLVGAAALTAAAVLLALLAADVRTWRDTMRADDLRFRAERSASIDWNASTKLPRAVSARLLAVEADRALRQAVALFRTARTVGDTGSTFERRHLRGDAEAALAAVAAGEDRSKSSQALNLLGILTFADATTGRRTAAPVERSLAAFQNAVRLDPGNIAAKANLELLLRLLQARGQRIGPNPGQGPRAGGRRGAGGGTPGRGY